MIETGTILQDRYLIEKQIGAGGMGAVYLAVDQRFGNHVALKETFYKDEEFAAAFEREAKLLNGLNHSTLPHVSDFFTENEEHFLVMQYIEGEDVSEILKRSGGAFPVETVLRWTDDLLDALDYLHSQNPPIIHRDIKPQNLKITTRGDIVLLDFGLAKLNSEDSLAAQSVFGYSRKYSSLEQIQGVGTDARSDIFSLAATVYHLLAGAAPTDVLARAADIVAGKPDPLPLANEINENIPSSVAQMLKRALALNAAERFDSAASMREALKNSVALDSGDEQIDISSREAAVIAPDESNEIFSADQNYPALAAFAADVKSGSAIDNLDQTESLAPSASEDESSFLPVAASSRKSVLPIAAVALLLLICAGLTAGYFINKSAASGAAEDASRVQSFPKPDVAVETTEANSMPAGTEQNENQTTPSETETAKEIAPAKAEQAAKPKAAVKNETVRRPAAAPRRESPGDGETRDRIVEVPSLPDIEAIFRGSRREREERMRRQQNRREEMSDEERDERRRRRQQRRQRQNRNPIPF